MKITMGETFEPGSVRDADELVMRAPSGPVAVHPDVIAIEVTNDLRNYEIEWEDPS
ncbi:hypothetical protein [Sandaracinus amylolyticus]|uniref:Uncharacterized protein n=1 Tax=Sandaracinus amylolyticus TaxID=927083 RepID=A0A0F6YHK9_9BACT|nr:hypothetical protein [Sandaracinus amylolyticus]AKF04191.1 hypothetical protein DB32_001340 [Sandaracinus amylolyticus]